MATKTGANLVVGLVTKYVWFIVVLTLVLEAVLYGYLSSVTPIYISTVTLFVNQKTPNQVLDPSVINVSQGLAETISKMAKVDSVLKETATELGLPKIVSDDVLVNVVPRTQLIRISSKSNDAVQASQIANTIAMVLSQRFDSLQQSINSDNRAIVDVVDAAVPSQLPSYPKTNTLLAVGLIISFVGAIIIFYIVELFDTTIRDEEDVEHILPGVPVLATFPVIHSNTDKDGIDQMRVLRNNVLFRKSTLTHSLTMVSFHSKEGRTYITARLGMFLAKSGKRVLLIDADFERSGLTQMANCAKSSGLSDLLAQSESELTSIPVTHWFTSDNNGCVDILPIGTVSAKQREALASTKIDDILRHVHDKDTYSFVLIDTPPLSESADALAIAPKTHGVLCIIEASRVKNHQLNNLKEEAELENFAIVGVILNKTKEKRI